MTVKALTDIWGDWLDRLELMIVIEDRFADVNHDAKSNQLEVVGDLIRHIENVDHERRELHCEATPLQ